MTPITSEYRSELDAATRSGIEFDLFDLLLALAEHKGTIILTTFLGLVIALVAVMFVHPTFTAKALVMPPQQGASGAQLVSQLGGLASLGGLGGASTKDPNDLYIALMQSETLEGALVKRFNLQSVYHQPQLARARAMLLANSKFVVEKGGLISITIKDQDPKRAAQIANGYVEELHNLNNKIAIGDASLRRLFFSEQLEEEKNRLADAEVALKRTEEETGAIAPVGQTSVVIAQVAQLQSQIINREIQLQSLRTSSTDQNPDVVRAANEIDGLRAQLRELERSEPGHVPGDISFSPRGVPQAQLEYIRKQRDVTYHTLLFDLIARQYEGARLDEAKAAPLTQLIDPAVPPDRKSAPFRALWVLVGAVLGFVFACIRVVFGYVFDRVNAHESHSKRILALRQSLKFGA
jgi:uncharacterized protein involved in exopolysaccharide biosynthesis